ncbi:Interferon regulatory factor 4 [Schistosoma japonicum]|nr:Interferon regulatory factor 4 [Schistosoma japonicum]KAH8853806.1 Interferon regulatory factor 4 [Schistosoma japonicum]
MDIRVRLRPWLESRLNDGWIEGLKWIDKEKGIFRIPWKHHSKHTWTEEDAAIFKDWAVVTGRYREGIDTPDWPMWKTRLRCALNKAPDIQEVKERHNLHCEEPFKVYRFVSKTESLWRANAIRNASMIFDGMPIACRFNSWNGSCTTGPQINSPIPLSKRPPLIVQKLSGLKSNSHRFALIRRSDGVHHIQSSQYRPAYILQSQHLNPHKIYYNPADMDLDNCFNLSASGYTECQITNNPAVVTNGLSLPTRFISRIGSINQPVQLLPDIMEPDYHQLGVRIQHLSIRVRDTIVTNPNGCCIYYGRFDEISSLAAPDPIEAQIPHQISVANKAYVDLLLDNMVRGIILTVIRGSIYAERICKCAVFVYVPTVDGEYILAKKLGRRLREKIFDYDQFLFHLNSYRQNQQSRPHFEVVLAFGQQLKPGISTDSLLVWSRVASCRAWFQLHKAHLLTPSFGECNNNTHLNNPIYSSTYHHNSYDNSEQSECIVLNRFSTSQNLNGCSNYNENQTIIKSEDDSVNEHIVSTINFTDSLDPDGIITEQIIEEGVEVPLDDTDDLAYSTSSSVLQENIIVCVPSQDVSSVPMCSSSSSITQDVFLNSVNPIDLKPHSLPSVHEAITDNCNST